MFSQLIISSGYAGVSWNRWFLPVLAFIDKFDIRMWCYINCDWDSFPMWQKNHAPGIYWGDTRIEIYASLRKKWESLVLDTPRFNWIRDGKVRGTVCAGIVPRHEDGTSDTHHPNRVATVKLLSFAFLLLGSMLCLLLACANCFEAIVYEYMGTRLFGEYTTIA